MPLEIVSPPLKLKCPSCKSKKVKLFYDMTGKDFGLFVLTLGFIVQVSRHYYCKHCKTIWRN